MPLYDNFLWEGCIMKRIMAVFGTRPDAIKMCPLVNELRKRGGIEVTVCVSGQHREMLDSVLGAFGVEPDYDLSVMKEDQSLFDIMPNGKKHKRHKMATHKRKKRLRKNRHKKKK